MAGRTGRTRVVCIGGGYVPTFLVRALRGAIRRGQVELTVISRDNFHTFHGFVGIVLSNDRSEFGARFTKRFGGF